MKVRVQRVLPDGNCLYRSLATGLIFQYTGFNCGSGGVPNKEKTLGEAFHNAAMMWIRQLVARRMNGEGVSLRTRWGKMSLLKLMRIAQKYLSRYGMHREFATTRGARRSFMRRIMPSPPRLVAGDGSNLLPCGVTANDLSLSVRRARESFRSYLSKIARLYTWGGEPECYVASLVLELPLIVYQKRVSPIRYSQALGDDNHDIRILFSGDDQHYDTIIALPVHPILKDR